MKTLLRSLACAVLCSVGVTSCVYDPYYSGPAGPYYGSGYSSISLGYYDSPSYYGGYGYPYGYRYGYAPYRSGYYGYRSGYSPRYSSSYHGGHHRPGSYPYASHVARPSSFRGSTLGTTHSAPRVSPGSISRPSRSTVTTSVPAPSRSAPPASRSSYRFH